MGNKYVVIHGSAKDGEEAIRMCGDALFKAGYVSDKFGELCVKRERDYPTGLPSEIPTAIPHVQDDGITQSSVCFLKLDKPVVFRRMDDDIQVVRTDMIFNLAIKDPNEHLDALQNMMSFLDNPEALLKCYSLSDEKIVEYLQEQIG